MHSAVSSAYVFSLHKAPASPYAHSTLSHHLRPRLCPTYSRPIVRLPPSLRLDGAEGVDRPFSRPFDPLEGIVAFEEGKNVLFPDRGARGGIDEGDALERGKIRPEPRLLRSISFTLTSLYKSTHLTKPA